MDNLGSKNLEPRSSPFYLILPKIQQAAEESNANLFDVIDAVTASWIDSLPSEKKLSDQERKDVVTKEKLIRTCEVMGVDVPRPNAVLANLAASYGINAQTWQDKSFVSQYRLHLPAMGIYEPHLKPSYDLFLKLFGHRYQGTKEEIAKGLEGYDLSIRPINFSSAIAKSEAIKNFLPDLGQKFEKDPFGVQRREHLVLDKKGDKLIYLATRKIEHGTYLAILRTVGYCTAGCAKCYRGEQTRQLQKFKAINQDGTEDIVYFLPPAEQIQHLVEYWNHDSNPPEDILFSGGEPMDIAVNDWKVIFEYIRKAKYLKFLRICTGDLFLGEPFRIADPDFLAVLRKWHDEVGKPIKFATHLPHPNFVTPAAVYTILKLHQLGIGAEIQTQTPLEQDINCFQREIEQRIKAIGKRKLTDEQLIEAWAPSLAKSFKLLHDLCIKIAMIADRPYKFIHDMQQSVSVIYNTIVFSLLSEPHVGTTDAAIRPTSFAVFTPKLPNLNMGFHSLQYLARVKGAYKTDGKKVKIKIPHAIGEIAEYEEPLWQGINDQKTLERIANIDFWKKLRARVKELI